MSRVTRLTIAVPRGALFDETLDLLDALGVDTAEVRANDRKLIFPDAGIVTMRPSDVPTYVEHGAADIGITGKDVLLEQSERDVYELLDLGFGCCRMVVAAREGDDPLGEPLRRLGRVRIATKYPRIATDLLRAHRPPGRDRRGQGLGRDRAADRPDRRDRRPDRHRHDARGEPPGDASSRSSTSTARLIANPVAHKLKAARSTRWSERMRGAVRIVARGRRAELAR